MVQRGIIRGKRRRPDHEEGVSVIVGTLLLILITVTAASGLAIMVSELQKGEMTRQSHQAAVKNEQLAIHRIDPSYNSSTGELEILNITILNLNTVSSRINLVGISDGEKELYPSNFSSGNEQHNNTAARLDIPGGKTRDISINTSGNFSTSPIIRQDAPLRIWVISSYYNSFEKTFRSPTADFTFLIESEDLGAAERDVIVLDGSGSHDDGSIREWAWTVWDGNATLPHPGNWSDTVHLVLETVAPGKTTRFHPDSPGPFLVRLKVTDDSGMIGQTENVTIPRNTRFFPATSLHASAVWIANQTRITALVRDLHNNPVTDATVTFTRFYDVYGNLTLDRWSGKTDATGTIVTNVTEGVGTVRVLSGKLNPADVPVG